MQHVLYSALGLAFTYFLSGVMLYCFASSYVRSLPAPLTFAFSLGLSPILISWLNIRFLSLFPHHSDCFYVLSVVGVYLALLAAGFQNLASLGQTLRQLRHARLFPEQRFTFWFFSGVLVLVMVMMFLKASLAVVENDGLQYTLASKLLYQAKSLAGYPFYPRDEATGFSSASAHPLGYYGLIIWSYMLQSTAKIAGLMKLINPIYALYMTLAMWVSLAPLGAAYSFLGVLLLLTTPLYLFQCTSHSIDPTRIYSAFVAFILLARYLEDETPSLGVACGVALGLSMFTHSLGLLNPVFAGGVYMLFSRTKLSRRLLRGILLGTVALLVGGWQYLYNLLHFGGILVSGAPLLNLKVLDSAKYFATYYNLVNLDEKFLMGFFQGFTKIYAFGLTYWIMAVGLVCFRKFLLNARMTREFLVIIAGFYALVLFMIITNDVLNLGHIRYYLTVQPLITYINALLLGGLYDKMCAEK